MPDVELLGVCGSPGKGATEKALQICLQAAARIPGVRVATISLAGRRINSCTGCGACHGRRPPGCPVFRDDFDPAWMERFGACDGVILASPVYSMNPTGLLYSFMSRMRASGATRLARAAQGMRMGGAVAVGGRRNGGQDIALAALNALLQSGGTNVVGGGTLFYNGAAVWSQNQKDFDDDTGVLELETLGRKVAFAARIVKAGMLALGDEIAPANLMGALSEAQLADAYRQLGL